MIHLNVNGIEIIEFEQADSTNKLAREHGDHLCAVVAVRQSAGRGRMGRSFFSPEGGLYMSVILDPRKIKCGIGFCTAAAALAARDALEAAGVTGLRIKWVNDLLQNGRKVCGILTEAVSDAGGINRIIVGIGINLCPPEGGFPPEIADRAGYVDYKGDRLQLAADITARLGRYSECTCERIAKLYGESIDMIGKKVELADYTRPGQRVTGTVLGVDESCFLRLLGEDGHEFSLSSGEIIG